MKIGVGHCVPCGRDCKIRWKRLITGAKFRVACDGDYLELRILG